MKISVVNVMMFSVGAVLLYSGIKAYNPRDVIAWGLGGKKPKSFIEKDVKQPKPKVPPEEHPGDQFGPPDLGPII